MDTESPHTNKNAAIVALLFAVSLVTVSAIVIHGLQGHYVRRVAFSTVLAAVGGFAMLGFAVLGRVIRIGTALWGAGAAIRLLTFWLHASPEVQRLSSINYAMLELLGSILVAVGAIQWFREAHLRRRSFSSGRSG